MRHMFCIITDDNNNDDNDSAAFTRTFMQGIDLSVFRLPSDRIRLTGKTIWFTMLMMV